MDIASLIQELIDEVRDYQVSSLNAGDCLLLFSETSSLTKHPVAATAVLGYDILLTLGDEIELIWRYVD